MTEETTQSPSPEDIATSRAELRALFSKDSVKWSSRGGAFGAVFDVNPGDKNHVPGAIGILNRAAVVLDGVDVKRVHHGAIHFLQVTIDKDLVDSLGVTPAQGEDPKRPKGEEEWWARGTARKEGRIVAR